MGAPANRAGEEEYQYNSDYSAAVCFHERELNGTGNHLEFLVYEGI
jgi:hypothetical protein